MSDSQPTYKRQRFLLFFIRQMHSGVSSTDLQKLVFLHTMESGEGFYDFMPYKYGAYSFQLAEDIEILRRDGYLSPESKPIKAIGEFSHTPQFNIATERGKNLIRKAYRKVPFYTINSEIIDSHFYGNETAIFVSEQQKYSFSEQSLFTIGYEGQSIEAFICTLLKNGIKLLCDVRKNPLSRKFGFSKGKLSHITGTVGIKYVHIPDLGIESDKRIALDTPEDYEKLFSDYSKKLPSLATHIDSVYALLQSDNRIALMCYEKEAKMCHRHLISNYLANAHKIRSADL